MQKTSPMKNADLCGVVMHAFPSELGWMAAAWRDGLLQKFVFGHGRQHEALRALKQSDADDADGDPRCVKFAARLQAFAAGEPDDLLDVPLESQGLTPFQL